MKRYLLVTISSILLIAIFITVPSVYEKTLLNKTFLGLVKVIEGSHTELNEVQQDVGLIEESTNSSNNFRWHLFTLYSFLGMNSKVETYLVKNSLNLCQRKSFVSKLTEKEFGRTTIAFSALYSRCYQQARSNFDHNQFEASLQNQALAFTYQVHPPTRDHVLFYYLTLANYYYDQAVATNSCKYYRKSARFYYEAGYYDKSEEILQFILTFFHNDCEISELNYLLGKIEERRGNLDNAIEFYLEALQQDDGYISNIAFDLLKISRATQNIKIQSLAEQILINHVPLYQRWGDDANSYSPQNLDIQYGDLILQGYELDEELLAEGLETSILIFWENREPNIVENENLLKVGDRVVQYLHSQNLITLYDTKLRNEKLCEFLVKPFRYQEDCTVYDRTIKVPIGSEKEPVEVQLPQIDINGGVTALVGGKISTKQNTPNNIALIDLYWGDKDGPEVCAGRNSELNIDMVSPICVRSSPPKADSVFISLLTWGDLENNSYQFAFFKDLFLIILPELPQY